jgi:hypothetical protein
METRGGFRIARRGNVCLVLLPSAQTGDQGVCVAQDQRVGEDGRDVRGATRKAGGGDEKRTTVVQLVIEHWKDLPADTAALISQRAYGLLFSKGVEVGVKATVLEQKESL